MFIKRHRVLSSNINRSYLAHRVAHEHPDGNPLLRCLRRVALTIQVQDTTKLDESVKLEILVREILPGIGSRLKDILHWEGEISEADYQNHLFAAGIRINRFLTVQRSLTTNPQLFSDLQDLRSVKFIYGSYDELVAYHSGEEIMEYLMTYATSTINAHLRNELFVGAARAGRPAIMRYIYNFKRNENPWSFGHEPTVLCRAQYTSCLEVPKFVTMLRKLHLDYSLIESDRAEYSLGRGIARGRLDTVRYAIQLGAHPRGLGGMGNPRNNFPTRLACMHGHADIVEYLLALGAGPERTVATTSEWGQTALVQRLLEIGVTPSNALRKASAGGYLDVVRLLLDVGVDPNEDAASERSLANAIRNKHTEMFNLLINTGAELSLEGSADQCVQRAKRMGWSLC